MGQGMAEVGSRIADIYQKGQQAMAQGIQSGIGAVADAYKDYKQTQTDIKAKSAALDTMLPYLDKDVQKSISEQKGMVMNNASMSDKEKQAYLHDTFGLAGSMINNQFKIQQINTQEKGAMDRAKVNAEAEMYRTMFPAVVGNKSQTFDPEATLLPKKNITSTAVDAGVDNSNPGFNTVPAPTGTSNDEKILRTRAYQEYTKNPKATPEGWLPFLNNYLRDNMLPQ